MNGCRSLFAKEGFEKIHNLGYGYSIRVGCYDVALDDVTFVSAFEVFRTSIPSDEIIAGMEAEALEKAKATMKDAVYAKAESGDVKKFVRGEKNIWWNSETRASIRASLEARTEGWYLEFGGEIVEYETKEEALAIVDEIEVYASDCHLAVCRMTSEIEALEKIEDVVAYEMTWPGVVVIED